MNKKSLVVLTAILYLIPVLILFSSLILFRDIRLKQEKPLAESGFCDLSSFDFSNKLALISHLNFSYYRGALYTPRDFAAGAVGQAPQSLLKMEPRFDPGDYGTYRIVLALPPGQTYGLSSYSAMYSQRLFIDGKEYEPTGVPATTAQETVPKTTHYTVYFTPKSTRTEILIQFANFYHYDFGGIVSVYVGEQDMINLRDALAQQRVHLLAGCMFTAFLLFLGMFLFFHKRYAFLWFSLACLAMALRIVVVNEKAVMLFFPSMSWQVSIGAEYLSLIVLLYAFLQYIHNMFRDALHRWVLIGYAVLCGFYAAVVLLSSPVFYTRFSLYFQISTCLVGVYMIVALISNIVRNGENRRAEHALIILGALVFVVFAIVDIQIHRTSGYALGIGLAEVGMLVLIFASMLALTIRFSRTEAELDTAHKHEQEMQQTNQFLDRLGRLKSDFMANISHEMRTPLTVMAGYAGLTALQIQHGAVDEETLKNLNAINREAIRLAELVEQLKDISLEKDRRLAHMDVDVRSLLRRAADFCRPICQKNRNKLIVDAQGESNPLVNVNADSIFQALINLVINANRHTKEGIIRLSARALAESGDYVELTVCDNGAGVEPDLLPSLFERGVSGDGGTGLGLAICREIIEEHGGVIAVTSEVGKGTCVRFTLPASGGGNV